MKKKLIRGLSLILAVILIIGILPLSTLAASVTYYQTNKADVPIWSQSNSSSTKIKTISTKGTVLKVTASTTNSSGKLWYKLSDGYWVYSGNVTKHSHAYKGGICTGRSCGYEYPYSVSSLSATVVVTNSSGAKIWSRPYSNNSTHIRTEPVSSVLSIVAKTTNQENHLWLKTADGYWVYSNNVTRRYTIKYNANGGSGAPSSQTYLSGKSVTISSNKPTRIGYIFQGWATSSSASSADYKPGKTYSISGNKTLYAVWKTCNHPDYTGGFCNTCNFEYSYSVSSFSGTFVVTNSSGAKIWSRPYSNKSTHVRTAATNSVLTVVAKTTNQEKHLWYKLSDGYWVYSDNVKQRFTINYNANGGSGAPSSQTYLAGNTITISSKKPTRTGYVFQGWATSSSASSASYKAGKSYTLSGNKTLYAVWKACGHSSYKDGYCKTCGYEYKLKITSISGTFVVTDDAGAKIWSRPYSGKSTHIRTAPANSVLSIVAKTTNAAGNLWYQLSDGNWVFSDNVKQKFTINYNANGGTGGPSSQTYLAGNTITISSKKPSKIGYAFQGWATSSSASNASYKAGKAYTLSGNKTLYAVWKTCKHTSYSGGICTICKYEYPLKETKYTGTFIVTNGDGAPAWSRPYSKNSKQVKIYDKDTQLNVVAKVKNIDADGKAANLWYKLDSGTWVYYEHITERYTIKYNANGGTSAPKTQYVLSGKTVAITKTKPSRVGYIFKGWATKSDSTKVSYKPGSEYSKNKNLTLYAVWDKCSHKYNSSGVCDVCKYQYKIKLDSTFTGSYVVIKSNGAKIRNVPYDTSDSVVRTAKKGEVLQIVGKTSNAHKNEWYKLDTGHWVYSENVALGYKVTYNANGGTSAPASTGFVSGKLVVSSVIPKRDGYVFMGWATSSNATKATYKTGDTYNTKKNITLYAVWEKCAHNYKNNYGICKNCKSEFPLVITSLDKVVYSVNNKNGTTTYQRPYSKSSEKVKKLSNKALILVVGSAKNANDDVWYKLKNGSWIKKSEVKKRDTYNTIDSIPYKYASVMIGNNADGGLFTSQKISGVTYLKFFDDNKAFYLNLEAFTGTNSNTQLASVNKALTNAVNNRTSVQKNFVYNEKVTKNIKAVSYNCDYNNHKTHNHIVWEISLLTAKAGITGSDGIYVRCQNNSKTITIEYCTDAKGIEHKWSHTSNIYPKFTVSTTPYAENGEAVGWFTDFELLGKGLKTEDFSIEDYVSLFSCAIKRGASIGKFVLSPTPKSAIDALKGAWAFYSKTDSLTKSTNYTSNGKNSLTYEDKETGTAYRTYKMAVTSPIQLQSPKDFLEAHIYLYELNKNQDVTIKIEVV